ncbi:MAG: DNA adenine methylase [Cyanobacteria bacterium J06639_1]
MPDVRAPAKPFLKWAGGKRRLLAQYEPHWPQFEGAYLEPFVGSGAVFFHWQPQRSHLSDINPELVNAYQCVRDYLPELEKQLALHRDRHGRDYYYATRSLSPQDLSPVQRAARLIYLNKTCFNGLYRENSRGEFNVPMGKYKKPSILQSDVLRAASEALQGVDVDLAPFWEVGDRAQPGDFVYFDPPYYPLNATSRFTAYTRHAFGDAEQVQLRDLFATFRERGILAAVSNSDCPQVRELYAEFRSIEISAERAINSKGDRRGRIGELLVLNY